MAHKKMVLMTGSNRGIGLALAEAEAYATSEWNVIGAARSLDKTDTLQKLVRLDTGGEDSILAAAKQRDGEPSDVAALLEQFSINAIGPLSNLKLAVENHGHVSLITGSIMENNVGVMYGAGKPKTAPDRINASLAVDVKDDRIAAVVMNPGSLATDSTPGTMPADQCAASPKTVPDAVKPEDSGRFYDYNSRILPCCGIVTGANSGIGFITALELTRHGADVVLACRTEAKGHEAVRQIEEELKLSPDAGTVTFRELDVSSLASVKTFTDEFKASHDRLDVLVNNAGLMAGPYALTDDGFESQFATNHLGHFALTAQLMELLTQSESARVVSVSSLLHKDAKMDLHEIMATEKNYDDMAVYRNTKLYNLLFTRELNRRLHANGVTNVIATAAHPGLTATNLLDTAKANSWWRRWMFRMIMRLPIVGTPETGALPQLYAATARNVKADDYFGPNNFSKTRGYPAKEKPRNVTELEGHARRLWDESERLAKLAFQF